MVLTWQLVSPSSATGTQIALTSFNLTKVITFTPYYSFHNKSDLHIEICESDAPTRVWIKVDAGERVTFWPEHKENCLVARQNGDDASVSPKFRYVSCKLGCAI